ncbi:transcriptional Coactivator p15-domain-containing protein [Aspergillus cavernicola]|uniref:Transcriptional Coactivator p15-domain-containing protein n=1 Tax=Aspergillus cavernicola TaxID=176166 RepID=A0ABR4IAB7_9EURO
MASRSRKRVSDDFIVDDDPPRMKKSKANAAQHSKTAGSRNSHGGTIRKEDSNGDSYWEISKMRRVTVSSFRGKTMISVREYYEKDGEELPGKKGISMPIDQFSTLLNLLPDIETALKEKGVTIPRPNYDDLGTIPNGDDGDDDSTDELSGAHPSRKNIEATSDEDESEE